jgi:hypothetical protein
MHATQPAPRSIVMVRGTALLSLSYGTVTMVLFLDMGKVIPETCSNFSRMG